MNSTPGTQRVSALDSVFLYAETPSTMMHVASLLRFERPDAADAGERLRVLTEEVRRESAVYSPWNRKLRHPAALTTPLQGWVVDENIDLDYHLRRSALPAPGDERELGILVSRLHSNPLDLSRPPWEMHIIEGLDDGAFAVYIKVHHALVDGYTGSKFIARGLSSDPDDRSTPPMFAVPPSARSRRRTDEDDSGNVLTEALDMLKGVVRGVGAGASAAVQVGTALGKHVVQHEDSDALIGPGQAPDTILNRRIGRNRRFATQQLTLSTVKSVGKACDATINDVCLAILGAGLRRFLQEAGELPDKPLIAFVPVNVRPKDDPGGGNSVGAMLATMGTDIADPVERLRAVAASTRAAKSQLEGMSQAAMIAYGAALLSPMGLQAGLAYTGLSSPLPLTFNVTVSNVPGPREDRYFRGSRLRAMHPVSIPVHGAGLNVTMMSYADTLNFGFIGDRDAVPHLQRLAVYSGEAFDELRERLNV